MSTCLDGAGQSEGLLAFMVTDYQGYTGLDGAGLSDAYWSWLCRTNRGLLALMVPDYQRSTGLDGDGLSGVYWP